MTQANTECTSMKLAKLLLHQWGKCSQAHQLCFSILLFGSVHRCLAATLTFPRLVQMTGRVISVSPSDSFGIYIYSIYIGYLFLMVRDPPTCPSSMQWAPQVSVLWVTQVLRISYRKTFDHSKCRCHELTVVVIRVNEYCFCLCSDYSIRHSAGGSHVCETLSDLNSPVVIPRVRWRRGGGLPSLLSDRFCAFFLIFLLFS